MASLHSWSSGGAASVAAEFSSSVHHKRRSGPISRRASICRCRAERIRCVSDHGNDGGSTKSAPPSASISELGPVSEKLPEGPENGSLGSGNSKATPAVPDKGALSLEEYEQLKSELLALSGKITGFGSAYFFLGYSLETSLSFAFGCAFSLAYLHLLFRAADDLSGDTVPQVFQGKLPRQKGPLRFVDRLALLTPTRLAAGVQLALSSRRLLIPGLMLLIWAASRAASGGDPDVPQLELAPLLCGFLCYKVAILFITFRDQDGLFG